ncbi:MAG: family 78 glycoside hydrolase catalytic domain [Candidatus Sumerlaeaceae bacterium]
MRMLGVILLLSALVSGAQGLPPACRAVDLKCEYMTQPLGIEVTAPRFSWRIEDSRRGARQTSYRILVASTPELLERNKADLWDSGKIDKDETSNVVYAGKPLRSSTRYFWNVQVWDKDKNVCQTSESSWWETGLLSPADWKAKWISGESRAPEEDTETTRDVHWLWYPGENGATSAPAAKRYFRTSFELPADKKLEDAEEWTLADNKFGLWVNGKNVANAAGFEALRTVPITTAIRPGINFLGLEVTNNDPGPAAVAHCLTLRFKDGSTQKIRSNGEWKCSQNAGDDWSTSSEWLKDAKPAEVLGPIGMKPWATPEISQPGGPATLLRKSFDLSQPIKRARLSVTALGSYRVHINGKRVGKEILTPEWTDYQKRVLYQTYDVTAMLQKGDNAIGVILGDGWYASGLGWVLKRFCFGPPPTRLLAQMQITFADGTSKTVATDESWQVTQAPILRSEIYAGETYDARLEQAGWDTATFKAEKWNNAIIQETSAAIALHGQQSPPIRVTEEIQPISITEHEPSQFIYDMGQNMVGFARLKVQGPAGTQVRMRFAEILTPEGGIYRENLRRADATDTYILKGGGEETFEPHFTYHGFRYIEVTGYPGKPDKSSLTGLVFHTDSPFAGKFETSNTLVNKIWLNTLWGLRGNWMSVPTDCPQRDERLGWMGDAQAIWRTACYYLDAAAFSEKWINDVIDAQSPAGGFSDVAPRVIDMADGAPAWGDAGIIVPHATYIHYNDIRLLQTAWPAMEKWMKYIHDENPGLLWLKRRNNDFGDWVPANSTTDKDLIATAYWAYDAQLMAQMARALGKSAEEQKYQNLFEGIRSAFQKKFIKPDGTIANGSQTCYVLPLFMNLVQDDMKSSAVKHLVDDITSRSGHLSTGFLGSTYLMPVLSDNGQDAIANKLLLNEDFPSWGYMIRKGATTIWERWNGDTGDPSMNSYNHYCYGAISEWLFRYMGGIDQVDGTAGYRQLKVRPHLCDGVASGKCSYDSINGVIATEWSRSNDGALTFKVTLPPNTTGEIHIPAKSADGVSEGEKPATQSDGLKYLHQDGGYAVFNAGAGSYAFTVHAK